MTLRKYLAGLALLFALPGVVLLVLGNGIAWAFFIIAGFMGIGALGGAEAGYLDVNGENSLAYDRYSDPFRFEYAGPTHEDDEPPTAIG